jgi:hypothetical protein
MFTKREGRETMEKEERSRKGCPREKRPCEREIARAE